MCIATPPGRPDEPIKLSLGGIVWATFITFAAALVWLIAHLPGRRRHA